VDLQTRINELKTKALRKIENAAKIGNTSLVVSNSRIVEEIDNLEKRLNQLVAALDMLEKAIKQNGENLDFSQMERISLPEKISRKKRGETKRNSFLKHAQELGLNISQVKGVRYKLNDRHLIGIAYASENRPNRWFLGLPPENFNTIVLLCEQKKGKMLNFIFSKDFYQKFKSYLSTDENGQLKYNIALRNTDYHLLIPQAGNENINRFLDNFTNLNQL